MLLQITSTDERIHNNIKLGININLFNMLFSKLQLAFILLPCRKNFNEQVWTKRFSISIFMGVELEEKITWLVKVTFPSIILKPFRLIFEIKGEKWSRRRRYEWTSMMKWRGRMRFKGWISNGLSCENKTRASEINNWLKENHYIQDNRKIYEFASSEIYVLK